MGVVAIVAVLAGVGCTERAEARSEDPIDVPTLRFEESASSLDALGEQVLEAFEGSDTVALEQVRLTEDEHNDVVWPELPAAAPEVNFPVDYAWTNLQNRNRRGVVRSLEVLAGRTLGFQRVECRGEVERFETFLVETDCWVVFTDGDAPLLREVQLFKDALRRGGEYKLFRYYDEEPRAYRPGSPR